MWVISAPLLRQGAQDELGTLGYSYLGQGKHLGQGGARKIRL
jgi:hypothetical protein